MLYSLENTRRCGMGDLVPRKELVRQGTQGIGGVGGGILLFVLRRIAGLGAGLSVPGLIVGGVIAALGLAVSTSKEDRTAGLVITGAGILTAIASLPVVSGLAGTLMLLSGLGLLVGGGISLFKFIRNLKKRS
jgi:hypothetical protein